MKLRLTSQPAELELGLGLAWQKNFFVTPDFYDRESVKDLGRILIVGYLYNSFIHCTLTSPPLHFPVSAFLLIPPILERFLKGPCHRN